MTGMPFEDLGTPPKRLDLSFPAYSDEIIKTVETAICAAWFLLKKSATLNLNTANETQITAALQDSIIDVLNFGCVDGFFPEIFNQPVRDASVVDFTKVWHEKKPDLTFSIHTVSPLASTRGIFFECKPIGNITNYFGMDGLLRFCDGRYAWAMPHAGMIGYVQRKTEPLTAKTAISDEISSNNLSVLSEYDDSRPDYYTLHVSEHDRPFTLINGKAPGSIRIRHLWLTP
jgi:hypothetical protein